MEHTITITTEERELILGALNQRREQWSRARDEYDRLGHRQPAEHSNEQATLYAALAEKIRNADKEES